MLKDQLIQQSFKSPSAALIIENGDIFWGNGIGSESYAVGELCFNTSQTGYQEILTDPSYAKQIITFTFPHIGIVGVNSIDIESSKIHACILWAIFGHHIKHKIIKLKRNFSSNHAKV